MLEKRTMIGLIQAYSVAMKHFLRGETGIFYEDLFPLIAFLPRYVANPSQSYVCATKPYSGESTSTTSPKGPDTDQLPLWFQAEPSKPFKQRPLARAKTFEPEKVLPTINADAPLRPARNPPQTTIWDYLPFLIPFRWLAKVMSRRVRGAIAASGEDRGISGKVKKPVKVESNVPLEITLFLSSYLSFLLSNGLLQAALATAYVNQMQSFQDCECIFHACLLVFDFRWAGMTALERVRNTPIPFAYQVHLRLCIWYVEPAKLIANSATS
jgi:ion channel-forming bestrophin family protein